MVRVSTPLAMVVVGLSLLPLALFMFAQLGRFFFLAELAGNFRAQILVVLLPFPLLLWLLRQWKWSAVMAVAVAWAMIGVVFVYLPGYQPATGSESIKLMSFNVLSDNYEGDLVIERVREEDPDVVVILEFSNHWAEIFEQLDSDYPYRVLEPRWHGFGIGVFSKYALEDTEVIPLTRTETDNPMIVTRVIKGSQKLRIAGVHLFSPINLTRMRLRNEQLNDMATFLKQSDEPTVVVGDFNCTPWSPFLSDFLAETGYRDSRQGFGYQASWHAHSPLFMIPIDHAFVSKEVRVQDRHLGRNAGSDHLPLIVELSVGK